MNNSARTNEYYTGTQRTSAHSRRWAARIAAVGGTVAALVLGVTIPANAGPLASGSISNSPGGLTLVTDWYDSANNKNVLTVTPYFDAGDDTSVHITSIRLCYSAPAGSGIYVRPELNQEGSQVTYLGIARNMVASQLPAPCTDWAVNKWYTAAPSGELFRVVNFINQGGNMTTIAAYFL